jgi:hypothetical protein
MRPVYGPSETIVAVVDAGGMVTLGETPGPAIASVRGGEIFGDAYGAALLGHVDAAGRVIDADRNVVGRVDASLIVYDAANSRVGRVIDSIDGGVLLLVVAREQPDAVRPTLAAETIGGTVMDEVNAVESLMKSPDLRGRRGEF